MTTAARARPAAVSATRLAQWRAVSHMTRCAKFAAGQHCDRCLAFDGDVDRAFSEKALAALRAQRQGVAG